MIIYIISFYRKTISLRQQFNNLWRFHPTIDRVFQCGDPPEKYKAMINYPKFCFNSLSFLPLFVHVGISAKIVMAEFWFWRCYFKCIFLAGRIVCWLYAIPLQTSHSYARKLMKILNFTSNIYFKAISYLKHSCCYHLNKSTSKHLSKRNTVSTKLSIDYPIWADSRNNLDAARCLVVIVNCVCWLQAMDHFASMHDSSQQPNDSLPLPYRQLNIVAPYPPMKCGTQMDVQYHQNIFQHCGSLTVQHQLVEYPEKWGENLFTHVAGKFLFFRYEPDQFCSNKDNGLGATKTIVAPIFDLLVGHVVAVATSNQSTMMVLVPRLFH